MYIILDRHFHALVTISGGCGLSELLLTGSDLPLPAEPPLLVAGDNDLVSSPISNDL